MIKISKHTELIKALEQELHRLSPDLSFNKANLDPYTQLLYIVKVSIDTLLEEKATIKSELSKLSREHSPRSCQSEPADVSQASSKLLDAQKELKKLERLLIQKEKKLNERESELKNTLNSFTERENYLKDQHNLVQAKSIEVDKRLKEIIKRENNFKELQDKVKITQQDENKKLSLHLTAKPQRCYSERASNIPEDSFNSNLKKFSEKLNQDKKVLESREKELKEKQLELKEKQLELKEKQLELKKVADELELKIKAFENEKMKNFNSSEGKIQKAEFSTDKSLTFDHKKKLFDPKEIVLGVCKELEQNLDVLEGEGPLVRIKELIEMVVDEINEKEKVLGDRMNGIEREEERMLKKSRLFYTLNEEFLRFKHEIVNFNKGFKKDIECMLSRVKLQFDELSKNLIEVENLRSQLAQSIFLSPSDP